VVLLHRSTPICVCRCSAPRCHLASVQRGPRIESYGHAREEGISQGDFNLVAAIDGNSHVRSWLRDDRGLVLTATDAEQQTTSYT
jgi:hypothetical protein